MQKNMIISASETGVLFFGGGKSAYKKNVCIFFFFPEHLHTLAVNNPSFYNATDWQS
jgi:hypothetical protein